MHLDHCEYLAELNRLGYSEVMAELDKFKHTAEIIASFKLTIVAYSLYL